MRLTVILSLISLLIFTIAIPEKELGFVRSCGTKGNFACTPNAAGAETVSALPRKAWRDVRMAIILHS